VEMGPGADAAVKFAERYGPLGTQELDLGEWKLRLSGLGDDLESWDEAVYDMDRRSGSGTSTALALPAAGGSVEQRRTVERQPAISRDDLDFCAGGPTMSSL